MALGWLRIVKCVLPHNIDIGIKSENDVQTHLSRQKGWFY